MKTFSYFLLFTVLLGSKKMLAQKPASEVTLTYNIAIENAADKTSAGKTLSGATLTIYIKSTDSRSDMVSTLGTESNLFDSKEGKGYILKEYSGQKLMITLNKDNWAEKNKYFQNMDFSIDPEVQEVAGYKCKKATATLDGGKTFVVYYSTEVSTSNKTYNNAFKNLPGIPVQYELESGKLKFRYTLTGVNYDNIPANKFDIPKSGFRVMTYEENQQLKKG